MRWERFDDRGRSAARRLEGGQRHDRLSQLLGPGREKEGKHSCVDFQSSVTSEPLSEAGRA